MTELHSSYAYGSGLTAIFSSVAAFNTVALAAVFMPILLMDGPLLQRSVGVDQNLDVTRLNMTIPMSPSPLMAGSTGIYSDHEYSPGLYHPLFAKVLQQYTNRNPVVFPASLCDASCEIDVQAPGWDIDCSTSEEPYRLANYFESMESYKSSNEFSNGTQRPNSTYDGPKVTQTVFDVKSIYNYTYDAAIGGSMYSSGYVSLALQSTLIFGVIADRQLVVCFGFEINVSL